MASLAGVEPATSRFVAECSDPLSYSEIDLVIPTGFEPVQPVLKGPWPTVSPWDRGSFRSRSPHPDSNGAVRRTKTAPHHLGVAGVAGAEGIEPSTFGFRDRRSTAELCPISSGRRIRTFDPTVNSRLLSH